MIIPIIPVAKPRMTRKDTWNPSNSVIKYRQFKDDLMPYSIHLEPTVNVVFGIRMPKTWSKKKKKEMFGKPHQKRPDLDNLIKALLDAVESEDSFIHSISATKVWDYFGFINIKK